MRYFEFVAQEWMNWSVKTFDRATGLSSLIKCKQEIKEIEKEILNGVHSEDLCEEYVDAIMCLLHSASKMGFDFTDIDAVFRKKFYKNRTRRWKLNTDNTYSHEK